MPDPRAHRAGPKTPAPEHARHRAPHAAAARRRAAALALVLLVAAAAVVSVVVLRQPPGPATAGPTTSASAPASASAGAAGSEGGGTAGGATTPSSAPGAAQAAAVWLAGQQPQPAGVAVDPDLYDDLASSALLASRLVPAPTATSGDEVAARWVVAGPALRADAAPGSWAAQALADSRTVAVFGDGEARVEVRELDGAASSDEPVVPLAAGGDQTTSPPVTTAPPRATATAADPASLAELERNPRLDFSPRAREALRDQQVDLRLAALLVQLGAQQPLSVSDLPASGGGTEPLRTVVVDGIAGQAVGADPDALALLQRQLTAQDPAYRATSELAREGSTQVLRLVLPSVGA